MLKSLKTMTVLLFHLCFGRYKHQILSRLKSNLFKLGIHSLPFPLTNKLIKVTAMTTWILELLYKVNKGRLDENPSRYKPILIVISYLFWCGEPPDSEGFPHTLYDGVLYLQLFLSFASWMKVKHKRIRKHKASVPGICTGVMRVIHTRCAEVSTTSSSIKQSTLRTPSWSSRQLH